MPGARARRLRAQSCCQACKAAGGSAAGGDLDDPLSLGAACLPDPSPSPEALNPPLNFHEKSIYLEAVAVSRLEPRTPGKSLRSRLFIHSFIHIPFPKQGMCSALV